jgi:hypothetical protein
MKTAVKNTWNYKRESRRYAVAQRIPPSIKRESEQDYCTREG